MNKKNIDEGFEKYMLQEGEPHDVIGAIRREARWGRWSVRFAPVGCFYPSDGYVEEFVATMKIHCEGKYAAPLYRLFLHTVSCHGNIAGQQYSPEMVMGTLADPYVRGRGNPFRTWIGPDEFFVWTAVVPPGGSGVVPPRQNMHWHIGSLKNWYWEGPLHAQTGLLFRRLICLVGEDELGKLSLSGELWPRKRSRGHTGWPFRTRQREEHCWEKTESIAQPLYFCDPFHGKDGLPVSFRDPGLSEGVTLRFSHWKERVFYRLGVLVSASPAYAELARCLGLEVHLHNSCGDELSCQVSLGTLAEATERRDLPHGWAASVPFTAPFMVGGEGSEGELRMRILVGDEEGKKIGELEETCKGPMKDPCGPSGNFLIITPYLFGDDHDEL